MTFQQMNTGILFASGDALNKFEIQSAKAWGQAQPRTSEEIETYCTAQRVEAEIQDFYKSFFNFDGVTA